MLTYFLTMQPVEGFRLLFFLIMCILVSLVAQSFGLFIGASMNLKVSLLISSQNLFKAKFEFLPAHVNNKYCKKQLNSNCFMMIEMISYRYKKTSDRRLFIYFKLTYQSPLSHLLSTCSYLRYN